MDGEFRQACEFFIASWGENKLENFQEQIKRIKLLACQADIEPSAYTPAKNDLFVLIRTVYEICLKICLVERDMDTFVCYMRPLKGFYFDLCTVLPSSDHFELVFGLNLMQLLASNSINEFHDDLERVPFSMLTECKYVRVPLMLEQHLLAGNYTMVRNMVSEIPSAEFLFFYEIILETVRDHIAEACAFAYESIPTPSLIKMLNLSDNLEYFNQLATKYKWNVSEALTIFPRLQSSSTSEDSKTIRKIDHLIKLSMDLETIV